MAATFLHIGQIYLPLMDRPTVKCVIRKPFCFSFEFNENWWSCSYLCVLKLHQVSLNSNETQKSFLMTHLMVESSVKGRWIWPLFSELFWINTKQKEKKKTTMAEHFALRNNFESEWLGRVNHTTIKMFSN